MAYGPIEIVVAHFPGSEFKGEILPELEKLVNAGIIRIVDFAFILKAEDGSFEALEVGDLPADSSSALGALVAEQGGLISDEDFAAFADGLAPGSSAALLLFENTWASGFVESVRNANGEFILNERIPRAVIEELELTA
jgi:uncharacterized membrane protein